MKSHIRIGLFIVIFSLVAASVPAGELGVPTDGLDLVLLTDGRVLACRAGEESEGRIDLEFPTRTVSVPAGRIVRIRRFRDFDPTPRTEDEKAKAAKGFIRWNGRWLEPKKAAAARKREEAPAKRRRMEDEKHSLWKNRWILTTKHFRIETNVPKETLDFYAELLESYYSHFTKLFRIKLTQRSKKARLPVYILRGREEFMKFHGEDTGGESEHTLGYFVPVPGKERLVLYDQPGDREETVNVLFHEGTHFILHLAEPNVLLSRWLHEGLAEYFGASIREGKKFVTGRIQDGRLLNFQGMIERKQVLDWSVFMMAGNPAVDGEHVEFDWRAYAQAWTFAHFLLHGKNGKYASGFVSYLQRAITGRGGVEYTPIAATARKFLDFEQDRDLLLKCLKIRSLDSIEKEIIAYAKGLPLRSALAYVERGDFRYWVEKDKEAAERDFRTARERGADDPRVLRKLAYTYGHIPEKRGEIVGLLERALELDPFDVETRYRYALFLGSIAGEPELRLCIEIDPEYSSALGDLAWFIYVEKISSPFKPESEEERKLVLEAKGLAARAVAIDPGHRNLDTLAALEICLGEFEKAKEHAKSATQIEPEAHMYIRRLAIAHAASGDVKAFSKAFRRLELILKRPRDDGDPGLPERAVRMLLGKTATDAAWACSSWGRTKEAAKILSLWHGRHPPVNPAGWYDWADAVANAGDHQKALEITMKGLSAFPDSTTLESMKKALEATGGE